uniref:Uncharacterized protein n=1 Tax=Anopheles coluzzii TaxID=1518534 RepID=A0A8W7PCH7_ANOCL
MAQSERVENISDSRANIGRMANGFECEVLIVVTALASVARRHASVSRSVLLSALLLLCRVPFVWLLAAASSALKSAVGPLDILRSSGPLVGGPMLMWLVGLLFRLLASSRADPLLLLLVVLSELTPLVVSGVGGGGRRCGSRGDRGRCRRVHDLVVELGVVQRVRVEPLGRGEQAQRRIVHLIAEQGEPLFPFCLMPVVGTGLLLRNPLDRTSTVGQATAHGTTVQRQKITPPPVTQFPSCSGPVAKATDPTERQASEAGPRSAQSGNWHQQSASQLSSIFRGLLE